jgi:CRP-like cAMP-binding protein
MTNAESFLQQVPLFERCSHEDLQRLALSLRWHAYRQGETILFQGVITHQMFLILRGRVGIYSRQSKETRRVGELISGDYFGEISLMTSRAATATVKAEEDDTQIYILERDVVAEALSRNPDAMADVTRKVQERNQSRQEAFSGNGSAPTTAPSPA